MRERISARCRLLPGKASDYIGHADDKLRFGGRIVLACRVSTEAQRKNGNLADQEARLRKVAESFGAIVVDVVRHCGSGADPYWIARPVAIAQPQGALLLAESTDRLIRHAGYDSKTNPDAQARKTELEDLKQWADGVPLVTVIAPDAPPTLARSHQSRRGQSAKWRKGGRPPKVQPGWKKLRREQKQPLAIEMRREGKSIRQIAKALNVPCSTVQGWILTIPNDRTVFCDDNHD